MRRWIAGLLVGLMLMQTSAAAFQAVMLTPQMALGLAEAGHTQSVQGSEGHHAGVHHAHFAEASNTSCEEHTQTGLATCAACVACCFLSLPSSSLSSCAPSFFISASFVLHDDTFHSYSAPGLERPPQLPTA